MRASPTVVLRRLLRLALVCLVFALPPAHATPATTVAAPATVRTADPDAATARFFNRDIATFRSRFLGNTPEMRARAAEANIERIVEQAGVAKATYQPAPQGVIILLDGQLVTVVTPADVDSLRNETLDKTRDGILLRLGDAVREAETARAPGRLARGIGWCIAATALVLLALWILRFVFAHLRTRADAWTKARLSRIPNESARHMALAFMASGRGFARVFAWIVVLFVVEEWLRFCFAQFAWTQPWAGAMTGWMAGRLSKWGNAILHAVPGLVTALVILLVARVFVQAIRLAFQGVEHGRFRLIGIDSQVAEPTRKLIVVVVWLFALAMAYPYLPGAETDAFKGLSLFVGLMVSLGASSIVGQAAGGFTLLYSRTMNVGDVVRIGEAEGTVQQIGLFTTRIRTPMGVEVSFPNNVVMGGKLENLSRAPDGAGFWLQAIAVIGYEVPWRQVHRLLMDAAHATPGVVDAPAPFVLQTALGDFGIEYRLRARIADVEQRWIALSALHAQIQDAFNAAGVQIMTPHYEGDPETAKIVPRAHWEGHGEG
ncbi:mechanosensitive ion channel family protein [Noviluteimonas gilva]|uniref:Small-conductance mechanosensitive channel n=1 Tax=Noviluteimonas gilva TaxID=2682097 RepID=A0A7C9LG51_9GAMM|nr:mechanosensitive ion channel family protein [Lysobacter gilvus]MUV13661.1 mechanosensitive ion channel [Lysobacter gilvus]